MPLLINLSKHSVNNEKPREQMLTIKETAALLGCSDTSLYRVSIKELPRYKISGGIRFKYSEIIKYINSKKEIVA